MNFPPLICRNIQTYLTLPNIHSTIISSIIELTDKRIASASEDGSIAICSLNFNLKTWNIDIFNNNAHEDSIRYLCEIPNSRIISCSDDTTLKVWNISKNELTLITILNEHTHMVRKVIYLHNEHKIISCAFDGNINIWNSEDPFEIQNTLKGRGRIFSIIHLTKYNKGNMLVSSNLGKGLIRDLCFWNMTTNQLQSCVKGITTEYANGLLELSNGNILVATFVYKIVIINPEMFTTVGIIKDDDWGQQGLGIFNNEIVFYCHGGHFSLISYKDNEYNIIYDTSLEENDVPFYLTMSTDNDKYIIAKSDNTNIKVFQVI